MKTAVLTLTLLAVAGGALAQPTSCVTRYIAGTAYTDCQTSGTSEARAGASVKYDPDAFKRGLEGARELDRQHFGNIARDAMAEGDVKKAIKNLYLAGEFELAMKLEDRLKASEAATLSAKVPVTPALDGVTFTPYKDQ